MKPKYILIIFALMISAIAMEPIKITSNSNSIITSNVKIPDNSIPLCENSSLKNTTEIILNGEGINFKGLGDLVLEDRVESGQMLIMANWANQVLNLGGGLEIAAPKGNESQFKITGKNLKIIEPKTCAQNATSGGIICRVNFTSRKISFFDAFSAL